MLSRTTVLTISTVLLGVGATLLSGPAHAASDAETEAARLARTSAAAHKLATAEPARQAELVAAEDRRVIDAELAPMLDSNKAADKPYRTRRSGLYTLVLTPRRNPYSLDDLRRLAPQTLLPQGNGGFLMRENILVLAGATLSIAPRAPLTIKMSSGPGGFVSLITAGGRLRLKGTAGAPITFQSWDESRGKPDTTLADGRAYVRVGGQFVAEHANFARLGFWSGRTGGVAMVGTAAALGKDAEAAAAAEARESGDPVAERGAGQTEVLPTGKLPAAAQNPGTSYASRVSDSTMTGNAFGLFVTGSSGAVINRTVIRKSLVDGLVLHGDVDAAEVTDVRVEQSGSDGVVVSREVEGAVLSRLVVRNNGGDGIVLTGRPLAAGPSASGASVRPFGNNALTSSESAGNGRVGVHVIGGTAIRVQNNVIKGGRAGVVVADGAADIDVDSNRVAGVATNGIQVRESSQVRVTGNVVRDSQTGIHVRNSTVTLTQNSTAGVTLHAVTFVGRVAGSGADRNLLAGSGTSAIDLVRADDRDLPELTQNDLSGWSRTVTGDSLTSLLLHPLTVIWILIALLLLGMSRPRRGGGGLPYRADPLNPEGAFTGLPSSAGPSRERENPVLVIPDRRAPVIAQDRSSMLVQSPIPAQGPARPAAPVPVRPAVPGRPAGPGQPPRPSRPVPTPAAGPVRPPLPVAPPLMPARGPLLAPVPVLRPQTAPAPASGAAPERDHFRGADHPPDPAVIWEQEGLVEEQERAEAPEQDQEPAPQPAGRVGSAVIDLAIREARLNPAAPRRRRATGR
jgi:hypothetical protein